MNEFARAARVRGEYPGPASLPSRIYALFHEGDQMIHIVDKRRALDSGPLEGRQSVRAVVVGGVGEIINGLGRDVEFSMEPTHRSHHRAG